MKYIKTFESFEVHDNSHGEAFYGDHAAGVLPICTITKRILVGLRSEEVNEPFTWGLFGGKFDENDYDVFSPESVAKRELIEETGYIGHIKLFPGYEFKTPNNTFTYYNFIGIVTKEFQPVLNWENEDAKWLTLEEIEQLDLHFGMKDLLINSKNLIQRLLSL